MMIVNKPFMQNDIITLKLVTGEEVISKLVEETMLEYRISKPLVLTISSQGAAMTPFLFTASITSNVGIPKTAVVALAMTDKTTSDQYIKGTTGIEPAPNNLIV